MVDGSTNLFTQMYRVVNKTGLLENPLVNRAFLSAYFGYKKLVEDPFAHFLAKNPEFLKGGHVLDVGANVGYTALTFGRYLDESSSVFAFEPDGKNFSSLQYIVAAKRVASTVHPVRAAVGDHDGHAELWINPAHHADHRVMTDELRTSIDPSSYTEKIPLITLDSFWRDTLHESAVSFVKVDVQGYELPVLLGMKKLLANLPNLRLAVEYDPKAMRSLGFSPEGLMSFLHEAGFMSYVLSRSGDVLKVTDESLAVETGRKGYVDLILTRTPL